MKNKRRLIIIITSLIVVFITAFIFRSSGQTADESNAMSDIFVDLVKKPLEFFGISASDDTISFIVRKLAHFSEYFVLCAAFSIDLLCIFNKKAFVFIAPVYCSVVAVCDEFLVQSATEGRSPELRDVFIDISGAILALLVIIIIYNYRKNKSREF
ncbi:MAG: VanZ family protein [Clostridia bacterium]|nr:VanZ family protein [Clostridia bacterium]